MARSVLPSSVYAAPDLVGDVLQEDHVILPVLLAGGSGGHHCDEALSIRSNVKVPLTRECFQHLERFERAPRLRRSAFSVPANIVEGFARRHGRARLNFLNIAEASLAEVWYSLHMARRLGYL